MIRIMLEFFRVSEEWRGKIRGNCSVLVKKFWFYVLRRGSRYKRVDMISIEELVRISRILYLISEIEGEVEVFGWGFG